MTAPFPIRPKRALTIDEDTLVDSVLRRAEELEADQNRSQWIDARLQRYAKYRGWLPTKTFPWAGASNVHLPILEIAELRTNAGLHNHVMTLRPLMTAKATNRGGVKKEEAITELIDAQLFLDPGPEQAERRFGDFISSFLQDGNAVAYTPWVREEGTVRLVRYVPPIPDDTAPSDYLEAVLRELFPGASRIALDGDQGARFVVTVPAPRGEEEATVSVYRAEQGDGLELVIEKPGTQYDGPVFLPVDVSHLLVPTRCSNLQPPTEWNPDGAPYVFLTRTYRIDELRRLKRSGTFNWLSDEKLNDIITAARSHSGPLRAGDDLESQKDQMEGREHRQPSARVDEDVGHLAVPMLLAFDRWDVDGDDVSEDCFFVIERTTKTLCEARLLTERWPAERPYRPLAEAIAVPVPGRWYGISYLELGEALYDLMKGTFDQSFDAWTIANLPSGFFAASSKLNAEVITWAPGQFYPVPGNPRETIYIPAWPQRDQSTALGIIGMAFQFFERVMASGSLQAGQVPSGKASALRTAGATYAILQQGDVRADQLLLRLFGGLRQVARNFHRMNRHLLPNGKEIRVLGYEGPESGAYRTIQIGDIDAEVDFDFRPDFLLSNPAVLAQALQSVLGLIGTPLAFQLGITDSTLFYQTMRDYIRALRLDATRSVKAPADSGVPRYLAEEAIDLLLQHLPVRGVPLEAPDLHLKKLFAFEGSEYFRALDSAQIAEFRVWRDTVARAVQQAQIVQAAERFQATGTQTPGAAPVTSAIQEPSIAQAQAEPAQGPGSDLGEALIA